MEPMSQTIQSDAVRLIFCNHALGALSRPRGTRLHVWFISAFGSILLWMCFSYFVIAGHRFFFPDLPLNVSSPAASFSSHLSLPSPRAVPPRRHYRSNGFLKVSCNGGLNQMRAAICDMVTVARLLNLTLVVPELDKASFWRDPSDFDEIFDVNHFIESLRDEVKVIRKLPKMYSEKNGYKPLEMPPVSWSDHTYYLKQILPLFSKTKVLHFNKTDARLANNGIPLDLQRLRCRVNFHALKFTDEIEQLGNELVRILRRNGRFVALHLRYEMDMLAFSGCTKGCSAEEAETLKGLRYAFPWWREKEINSDERRSMGLCPLTPEETALTLHALGFAKETSIYIAAGDIYGGEKRMRALTSSFPKIVRKEMLLDPLKLEIVKNHSTRMAALDFMVSNASDVFISTYDGNMARLVEGHRRYYGFKKTVSLDRRKLVELLDMYDNGTLAWNGFAKAVRSAHEGRTGRPVARSISAERPKEEKYFYANPVECLCQGQCR